MSNYTLYDEHTAPEASQALLSNVRKKFGMIPNLYGYLAQSPVALNASLMISNELMMHSSLTPAQVQVALLAISEQNNCEFCIAAHSWVGSQFDANPQTVKAIREGGIIQDTQDHAMVTFLRALVSDRGHVTPIIEQQFYEAGFSQANMFDLLVCNMLKSLTNYANHLVGIEINPEFIEFAR